MNNMTNPLQIPKSERFLYYFQKLTEIPRGSGDMEKVSAYCVNFAKEHSLKYLRDDADNVIIYKDASAGYEKCEPIILQGHMDMVCRADDGVNIDFTTDPLNVTVDGDFIKATGTTLGADNGIAVAMILAILEDDKLMHPPIEAVLTTDEEIGMLGAIELDFSKLKGRKMINIDSENPKVVTVSCAGGSDFEVRREIKRREMHGTRYNISVKGLRGGHSGVEINGGGVNANLLMGRILNHLRSRFDFNIIDAHGGDKGNVIPGSCTASILTQEKCDVVSEFEKYADLLKYELASRESGVVFEITRETDAKCDVATSDFTDKIIYFLVSAPNGVVEMSMSIDNLVETSLNLGILKIDEEGMYALFTLRSNIESSLAFLEEKLKTYVTCLGSDIEIRTGGYYPPWEYNENSKLQKLYCEKYKEKFGEVPLTEAIHAGLECGVFASHIADFDCISIGPEMYDIHTTKERLSISSSKDIYEIIVSVLRDCY